jgi:hypothetical protein
VQPVPQSSGYLSVANGLGDLSLISGVPSMATFP